MIVFAGGQTMDNGAKKQTKNTFVELLRFLFCIVILIHHSGSLLKEGQAAVLPNGAIAVEFFYMLSGFFAMKHIARFKEKPEMKMGYCMSYSFDKIKKVLPFALIGMVALYAFYFGIGDKETALLYKIYSLKNLPFEASMLTMTGIIPVTMTDIRNTPLWFLSALFIVLPLVMYLAMRFEDVFKGYIVWILPPVLYAYLCNKYTAIFAWGSYGGFLYGGVIRAFADLTLGFGIFYALELLQNRIKKNVPMKICGTIISLLLLAYTIKFCATEVLVMDQIIVTYFIFVMLILVLGDYTYFGFTDKCFLAKPLSYLGSLAMPVYCLHWAVYTYLNKWAWNMSFIAGLMLNIAVSLVLSVILLQIVNIVKKRRNR